MFTSTGLSEISIFQHSIASLSVDVIKEAPNYFYDKGNESISISYLFKDCLIWVL